MSPDVLNALFAYGQMMSQGQQLQGNPYMMQPPGQPSLDMNGQPAVPPPTVGQPTPAAAPAGKPGILSRLWNQILTDPRAMTFLLSAGSQMMQPLGFGENTFSRFGNSMIGGLQSLAALQMVQRAREEQLWKRGMAEREMGLQERGVATGEKRATTEARSADVQAEQGTRRLDIQQGALDIDWLNAQTNAENVAANKKRLDAELKLAEEKLGLATQQANFEMQTYEDRMKAAASNEAARAQVAQTRANVAYLQAQAALAKVGTERIKALKALADNPNQQKLIDFAYTQAAREMQTAAPEGGLENYEKIADRITQRANALYNSIKAATTSGATSSTPDTSFKPVTPANPDRTRTPGKVGAIQSVPNATGQFTMDSPLGVLTWDPAKKVWVDPQGKEHKPVGQ